ncbi:hypothetical protein [Puniceibacterium antarcticum]|uniref:hypothetical protein n=1 Tax=Puniceibacterium antarcticum TaxID=1206336 RepID=UPI001179FA24|nr:hypothetical protein [Puniceibacterium antarcticum]
MAFAFTRILLTLLRFEMANYWISNKFFFAQAVFFAPFTRAGKDSRWDRQNPAGSRRVFGFFEGGKTKNAARIGAAFW